MTAAFAIAGPRSVLVQWAGWLAAHAPARQGRRLRATEAAPDGGSLPPARSVLAITARPGKESADLGGLLHAFRTAGAQVSLLCLTRGEASALNNTSQRLELLRPRELQLAAGLLGVSSVAIADYPDGELRRYPIRALTERVQRAMTEHSPDLILVVDPAVGDADDAQVARAAGLAAGRRAYQSPGARGLALAAVFESRLDPWQRRLAHPAVGRGRPREPGRGATRGPAAARAPRRRGADALAAGSRARRRAGRRRWSDRVTNRTTECGRCTGACSAPSCAAT